MKRFNMAVLGVLTAVLCLATAALAQAPSSPELQSDLQEEQRRYEDQRQYGQPSAELTLPAGMWIPVRVDQELSSSRSRVGETFTATLAQPLIVDGFVVARRGQIVAGRVAEARRAGRVEGTSGLGLEIVEITLADGQQVPVLTQWIEYEGPTSVGSDVATIATVTGVGAAIGAAADGGRGAGLGALAGAAASAIGILSTRGKSVEIYPESTLTFRTLAPVAISTAYSAHAFLPVRQDDYDQDYLSRRAKRINTRRVYMPAPRYYFDYDYRPRRRYYSPSVIYFAPRPYYVRPHYVRPRPYYYAPRIIVAPRIVVPRYVNPRLGFRDQRGVERRVEPRNNLRGNSRSGNDRSDFRPRGGNGNSGRGRSQRDR